MLRRVLGLFTALPLLVSCSVLGDADHANEYPSDEIRLIIPYAAGGPTDTAGRAVARYFEHELGQAVVVENLVGASATAGTTELVGSRADGYTIEMATTSPLVLVPQIQELGYDKDAIETIGVSMQIASVLAVRADSPHRTAEDFFTAARNNPESATVALPGANTPQAIELRRLRRDHGIKLATVPFNGDSEAATAVLGGNSEALFGAAGEGIVPRIESGEFRALAVGSEQRLPYLPQVPTLKELGFEGMTLSTSTYGLIAPDGTPQEIVQLLEETLRKALADPVVREQIGEDYIPVEFAGARDFRALLDQSWTTYAPILRR